jgi:hypothetical protein
MSDEPKKRSRSWRSLGWIGWTALALLLVYPLSIGPAVWISTAIGVPGDWINTPYRPVLWLAFQSRASNKILYGYMNLYSTLRWGRHPPSRFDPFDP